MLVVSIFFDY